MAIESTISHLINNQPPLQFVRNGLFGDDCWLFRNPTLVKPGVSYQIILQDISATLNINPNEVSIIGSAKLGVSLSPNKLYQHFRVGKSDIDIAIVSDRLFHEIWSQMVDAYYNGYRHLNSLHSSQIFSKFIVLKGQTNYHTQYLRKMSDNLDSLNRVMNDNLRFSAQTHYRIYNDWTTAERYHVAGIEKIRRGQSV